MRPILFVAAFCLSATLPRAHGANPGLSEEEAKEGFVSLFDGRSLDGWQGDTAGYVAEDGTLVCKKDGGGKLFTKGTYRDFVLRFEFKLEPGGNNGVAIRCPVVEKRPAYEGMEIQILDDSSPTWANLKPYQYHGSIYGLAPARRGHLKPVGQWNSEEITCQGRRVIVKLNGATIVDADLDEVGKEPMDGREHPGLKREEGHIGFLGHHHRVEFRTIRVKQLSAE